MKKHLFLVLTIFLAASAVSAQSRTNRIWAPCPEASFPKAHVSLDRVGNINIFPCVGKTVNINTGSGAGTGGVNIDSGAGITTIGDVSQGFTGTTLSVDDTQNRVVVAGDLRVEGAHLNLPLSGFLTFNNGSGGIQLQRTTTPGGTTGNQTIDKMAGTVNFAAAATTVTVTNNKVLDDSYIFAVIRTNDATCAIKNVVPGSGSFVIRMTAGCTAETSVAFLVMN